MSRSASCANPHPILATGLSLLLLFGSSPPVLGAQAGRTRSNGTDATGPARVRRGGQAEQGSLPQGIGHAGGQAVYSQLVLEKVQDRGLRMLLERLDETREVAVIATTSEDAEIVAARAMDRFETTAHVIPLLPGFSIRLEVHQLLRLLEDPGVSSVSNDWPMQASLDVSKQTVRADVARLGYGLDGSGITVAVIDSGIARHDDFGARTYGEQPPVEDFRVRMEIDFVQDGAPAFSDPYGHGTHVAGIIGGSGLYAQSSGASADYSGIAPGVDFISLRVLDAEGRGFTSSVIEALQWVHDNYDLHNIRAVNLSLGHAATESYFTDPLCHYIKQVWQKKIAVVTTAGNWGRDGYGRITSPGICPRAITVGASNSFGTPDPTGDAVTTYSSRGPTFLDMTLKPDLVAPGNKIVAPLSPWSTLGTLMAANRVAPSASAEEAYLILSGTSMAAPMVSGAAALMFEQDPLLKADDVKGRLLATTYGLAGQDIFSLGTGVLDIEAALGHTGTVEGIARSPRVAQAPDQAWVVVPFNAPPQSYEPMTSPWGDEILWPTTALWGGEIQGATALWGDGVPAGDTSIWGDTALWGGETTQRGQTALWGD